METNYNPWPIGQVPEQLQRPELKQLKEAGYLFNDPREVINIFEERICKFTGSPYAVLTDCCTHAMELSLRYQLEKGIIKLGQTVVIPDNTYVSCYWMLKNLGFKVFLYPVTWQGEYLIGDTNTIDAAVLWKRNMYKGLFQCISFQIKKRIPIGRGGVILTDNKEAYEWLKLSVYDGRDMSIPYDKTGHVKMPGWHYYMTPEDAARGLILMDSIKEQGITGSYKNYPSITQMLNL